jgi:hypothetical protein
LGQDLVPTFVQILGINAPVQARWANAQRAGISTPNPPAVACNRVSASEATSRCQR